VKKERKTSTNPFRTPNSCSRSSSSVVHETQTVKTRITTMMTQSFRKFPPPRDRRTGMVDMSRKPRVKPTIGRNESGAEDQLKKKALSEVREKRRGDIRMLPM
jgi:hypothetical protein